MAKTDEAEERTATTSLDIQNAVETAGSADESVNEDDDLEDQDDSKAEDDDSKDDDSSEDEDKGADDADKADDKSDDDSKDDDSKSSDKSEYRYSQFAGDGKPETYIKNLEEGYKNSSAEAVRLNTELKQTTRRMEEMVRIIKSDPDLDKKMDEAVKGGKGGDDSTGKPGATNDPFLVNAQTEWREQSEKSAQEFIDANPEVVSDPKINADVKRWMEVISAEEYNTNGKLMTAGEAMTRAYKLLGYEDKRETRKSMGDAKKAAAPTRPQGSKKPAKTASDFTDSQLNIAEQMGVSKEKLDKYGK